MLPPLLSYPPDPSPPSHLVGTKMKTKLVLFEDLHVNMCVCVCVCIRMKLSTYFSGLVRTNLIFLLFYNLLVDVCHSCKRFKNVGYGGVSLGCGRGFRVKLGLL